MERPRDDPGSGSPEAFSLVDGGPFCHALCRARLMSSSTGHLGRRLLALVLATWLPLFVLAAAAGTLSGGVAIPFLRDPSVHARLLVALPLLLVAEVVVHRRIGALVRQFDVQGLVPPEAREAFDGILRSSRRIAGAGAPEALLALTALTLGHWLWSRHVAMPVGTWYDRSEARGLTLTPAGAWFAFVSLPFYRFMLYRWYFRLGLWYRLLWKVSRLPLRLNPAHPDQAGGLGFLGQSLMAFAPILVAHTVMVAGLIADHILHRGAVLTHFRTEVGFLVAALLLVVLAPLLFFSFPLARARRAALAQHGAFAARYVEAFARKWLQPADGPPASPLGSSDIQSLADLGTHFRSVRETRLIPVSKRLLLQVGVLLLLPIAPLLLTMMPLEEVVDRLAKLML